MCQVHIGTSGWSYKHWQGLFYPPTVPASKYLEYYATVFDTVELNSTFYRTPQPKTAHNWYQRTPERFVFSVKGSRFITHRLRLRDCAEPLARQTEALQPLGEKLGPVFWQFPPSFGPDLPLLADFVALKPAGQRWAFEFRHPGWFSDEVYEFLAAHNCALIWADSPRYPLHTVATADFLYARLHGHEKLYASNYDDEQLRWWKAELEEKAQGRRSIYVYFDNDVHGYAPANARRLKEMFTQA